MKVYTTFSIATLFGMFLLWSSTFLMPVHGQTITEIIDATGDGGGNTMSFARGIAVDGSGNAFVGGATSDNVFKITPGGTITQIIDATGDGGGNVLDSPDDIAVGCKLVVKR